MRGSRYKKCFVCQRSIRKFLDVVTLMKESNITKGEYVHRGICEKRLATLLNKIYN